MIDATAAVQRIVADTAAQRVAICTAGDGVVGGIAGAGESPRAGIGEIFDVGQRDERVGSEPRLDGVDTIAAGLIYCIACVVDDIGVVAEAAGHSVGASAAVQRIVAGAAFDEVGSCIAGAGEVARSGEGQVLDIGGQRIDVQRRVDVIRAGIRGFGHDIAGVIDMVIVVAGAAGHPVRARAAIQRIVAAEARERIVAGATDDAVVRGVADAGEIARPDEGQVFEIGRQREGIQSRLDGIGSAARPFNQHIAQAVDDIGVVAIAADHAVIAGAAIERVVAVVSNQRVVVTAAEEAIVARARIAFQRIVAREADQRVIAAEAFQRVVAAIGSAAAIIDGIAAGDAVVEVVAIAGEAGTRRRRRGKVIEDEIFDVRTQRVIGEERIDRVVTAAEGFHHLIADIADGIEIVTRAADHGVVAVAAVERVVARDGRTGIGAVAVERVVAAVADQVVVAAIADHAVAAAEAFEMARIVRNEVRRTVVAAVADQRVGRGRGVIDAAPDGRRQEEIERPRVGAVAAEEQGVVYVMQEVGVAFRAARIGEIVDNDVGVVGGVGRRVRTGEQRNRVVAARTVIDGGVRTGAAFERIVAAAAIERVVAVGRTGIAADERRVAHAANQAVGAGAAVEIALAVQRIVACIAGQNANARNLIVAVAAVQPARIEQHLTQIDDVQTRREVGDGVRGRARLPCHMIGRSMRFGPGRVLVRTGSKGDVQEQVIAAMAEEAVGALVVIEGVVAGRTDECVVAAVARQEQAGMARPDRAAAGQRARSHVEQLQNRGPALRAVRSIQIDLDQRVADAIADHLQITRGRDADRLTGDRVVAGIAEQRTRTVDDIVAEAAMHRAASNERVVAAIGIVRGVEVAVERAVAGDAVIAVAAVDLADAERAAAAVESVVAAVAEQRICAVDGRDAVVARTAMQLVGVLAAIDDVVAAIAVDGIVAEAAIDGVGAAGDVVGIVGVAEQAIRPVIAVDHIAAMAAHDRVVAGAAQQNVVAGAGGDDGIVAAAAVDVVVAVAAIDRIAVAEGAVGGVAVAVAAQNDVVIRGRIVGAAADRNINVGQIGAVVDHASNARRHAGGVEFERNFDRQGRRIGRIGHQIGREIEQLDVVELILSVAVQDHMIGARIEHRDPEMIDGRDVPVRIFREGVLAAQAAVIDPVGIAARRTAVDGVVAAARDEGVVAGTGIAFHGVVAGATVDVVVSGAADDGVVAVVAGDRVVAVAGIDRIIAAAAVDEIGAGAAQQRIAAVPATDRVAVIAADDIVVASVAGQHVEAGAAIDEVVAVAAEDGVVAAIGIGRAVAVVAVEEVDAAAAEDAVIAVAAIDFVVEGPGIDGVVAGNRRARITAVAVDDVVLAAAEDGVVAGIAGHRIAARAPVQRIVAGAAEDRVVARTGVVGPVRRGRAKAEIMCERRIADVIVAHAEAVVDQMTRVRGGDVIAVGELQVADADQFVGAVRRARTVVGDEHRRALREARDIVGRQCDDAGAAIRIGDDLGDRVFVAEPVIDCGVVDDMALAAERVVAATADEVVVAGAAQQKVAAVAAIQRIVAIVAFERIAAVRTKDGIVAGVSDQRFVAGIGLPEQRVHDADEGVVAGAAPGRVVGCVDEVVAARRIVGIGVVAVKRAVAIEGVVARRGHASAVADEERIEHGAAAQRIVVEAADQRAAAREGVIAGIAGDQIVPADEIAGGRQHVIADIAVDGVVAHAGIDRVVALIPEDDVVAVVEEHQVIALAAEGVVVAVAAIHRVRTARRIGEIGGIAVQRVVAGIAIENVVAVGDVGVSIVAHDQIVAVAAVQHVVAGIAIDRVVARAGRDDVVANRSRRLNPDRRIGARPAFERIAEAAADDAVVVAAANHMSRRHIGAMVEDGAGIGRARSEVVEAEIVEAQRFDVDDRILALVFRREEPVIDDPEASGVVLDDRGIGPERVVIGKIVAAEAIQRIVVRPAGHPITVSGKRRRAADQRIAALPAAERVVAVPAPEHVAAGIAFQRFAARIGRAERIEHDPFEGVVAAAAIGGIARGLDEVVADNPEIARERGIAVQRAVAVKRVVAGAANQARIHVGGAVQCVVARAAVERDRVVVVIPRLRQRIVAGVAFQRVETGEVVVAVAADQVIGRAEAENRIVAGVARNRVVAVDRAGGGNRIVAVIAEDQVVVDAIGDGVVPRTAQQRVVAFAAVDGVVLGAAVGVILAVAGIDVILAAAAIHLVVARAAIDDVIAEIAVDQVIAVEARQDVVAGVVAGIERDRVAARRIFRAAEDRIGTEIARQDVVILRAEQQRTLNIDRSRHVVGTAQVEHQMFDADEAVGAVRRTGAQVSDDCRAVMIAVVDQVILLAAGEMRDIVARAAEQQIVAAIAAEIVVARAAEHGVFAAAALQRIVALAAAEIAIGARPHGDRVVAAIAKSDSAWGAGAADTAKQNDRVVAVAAIERARA